MLWQKDSKENDAWYIDLYHRLKIDPEFGDLQLATKLYLRDLKQMNVTSGKNNKNSIDYRRQGDIEFEMKNWHEAIELYNKSLCHAEMDSPHIGLAYAKRAQCFSGMKMFDKCLIDIELAQKAANYPDDQLIQLKKRKEICLKLMECGAQVKLIEPKLDFGPHEMFPEMANVLAFRRNDEYGRYVVTTADIDVGQVILFEKCFATKTDEFYQHCNICMKGQTNLVPCSKCTTALYCCNTTCENNKIHSFECDVYPILKDHWHAISMGVRTVLIGLTLFSNADELMEFVEDAVTNSDAVPTSITDTKTQYRMCLQNIKASFINDGGMKSSEKGLAFITPVIYRAIVDHKLFNGFFTTEKHRRFLMHLVYYHMAVGHAASGRTDFPTILQYINHSCIPCLNTFLIDGYVIGVAFRPIRKGEQVFKCYFDIGLTKMSFDKRQQYLLKHYRFQCKCERCTIKDVPPTQCVKALRSDPNFRFLNRFVNESNEGDQKQRKFLMEKAKAVLRKHQVVWADGLQCPLNVFRNLLIFKYNNKTEF